jgi:hypothetical protein
MGQVSNGRYSLLGYDLLTLHTRVYGPIFHFRVGLKNVVVINDPVVYRELLDQR